jgi:hypothetical protein
VVQQQQREQAGRLRVRWQLGGREAGAPERLLAQLGVEQLGPGGCGEPLVEYEIDDRADTGEPFGQPRGGGDLEVDA